MNLKIGLQELRQAFPKQWLAGEYPSHSMTPTLSTICSCVETNVSKTIPVPATASNKPAPLVNPLDALFGPPSAPSTRRDALTADKASVPPRASPLKTATKDGAPEKVKEITASASAKNLCYIAYLETHERISSAAFNDYYKNLPKDEIKAWNSKSKLAKLKAA
ncbi:hypothetical protein BDN70DRAFT_235639 [Pholiota conissans]|uniref:Uncharacterized protein n=1 Tax=Pholiota conissans TaxID=109636 RepID=A0A9P5ZDK7_9AGAR|nr:hypothetical protein BDN70DRAFT_235639 [Pholiota conissans]